ncbi:PREDICTED: SAP30-binding protein [Nicotiana attenuata]|uniref:SAP30-binding protein n=1 Tax=Nicotiana attenuata TaxID=49451 RepID=UPI00090598B8|nr:PREDICTED: SAP30-binding protein [Nicotiana attenuata]
MSQKKESEGIALLSIYGDDEDDEMEDMEERQEEEEEEARREEYKLESENMDSELLQDDNNNRIVGSDSGRSSTPSPLIQQLQQQQQYVETLTVSSLGVIGSTTTTPFMSVASPNNPQPMDLNVNVSRRGRLTIVDYGHDEVNMSPETEEGEIMASGRVLYGEELQTVSVESIEKASPALQVRTPSTQTPPQSAEPSDRIDDVMDFAVNEGHGVAEESDMVPAEEQKDVDLLEKFLSPPPKEKCSDELQEKIIKFLALKKTTGRSFNAEVRNRKEYRNPDFLLHAVTYQDIDQIGSCFSKDVFDPRGYDKSDFYDEIEVEMKREMERREQERKRSPKVDFISGGTQPAAMVPTPKINLPIPDVVTRDGRQNKKSKWDKVDVDRRDPVSAVGAHAALLSAANAGTGYTAYAQQRRKEAEEKRPSDKKLDRRS